MRCSDFRDRLSALLEGRLSGSETARVGEHVLACRPCRRLRDELSALLGDLAALRVDLAEPPELADRILAAVPAPAVAAAAQRRTVSSVAWRRAAAWAVVFLGAWWQLVGFNAFPEPEALPDAREAIAHVVGTAAEQGREPPRVLAPIGRASRELATLGTGLHEALFPALAADGAEPSAQTRPASTP